MRRWMLMVMGLSWACSAPVAKELFDGGCRVTGGGGGFGGANELPDQILRTDQEVTVTLAVFNPVTCDGDRPQSSGVRTEVLGPDNLPVTHMNTGPTAREDGFATDVVFTPMTPGPYHFVATFEPSLGIAQLDLRAALNRARRLPLPGLTVLADGAGRCNDFALTAHDAVICQRSGELAVFRAGIEVQTLGAVRNAVDGNTVWTSAGAEVTQYTDTGTGPLVQGAQLTAPHSFVQLMPSASGFTLVEPFEAHRYELENGALVERETWTYQPNLVGTTQTMAATSAGGLVVATESSICSGPDGGSLSCLSVESGQNIAFVAGGVWRLSSQKTLEWWAPGVRSGRPFALPFGATPYGYSPQYFGNMPMIAAGESSVFTVTEGPESYLIDWSPIPNHTVVEISTDWEAIKNANGDVFFVR